MQLPSLVVCSGPRRVLEIMQSVTNAVRSRTTALNRILVTSGRYSNALAFMTYGYADEYVALYDPAANQAIELHCYLDAEGAGGSGVCVSNAPSRLNGQPTGHAKTASCCSLASSWAATRKSKGRKAGRSSSRRCASARPQARTNGEAGPPGAAGAHWQASYKYRLEPSGRYNQPETPQFGTIREYLDDNK